MNIQINNLTENDRSELNPQLIDIFSSTKRQLGSMNHSQLPDINVIIETAPNGYVVKSETWLPEKKHFFADSFHEDLLTAARNTQEKLARQIDDYAKQLQW